MAKFQPTNQSVTELIESLPTQKKQDDAYQLLAMYERISQKEPVVWYPGIIGFGQFHYVYETGHSGDAPLLAFAPRKAKISLYLDQNFPEKETLLAQLGKHKRAVGCVYINKLADIDIEVLETILIKSLAATKNYANK